MVNKRISNMFKLEVATDNNGSITIPAGVFIKNKNSVEDIKSLLKEEALRVGHPFYFSTVSTSIGIVVTWSKVYSDALPDLSRDEELLGDGLVYIVRKVG